MSRTATGLLLAVATGCALATAALATPAPEVRSARVGYADLNLNADAGVDALYARLRRAAARVCATSGTLDLRSLTSYYDCAERSLAAAIAAVGNASLSARYGHMPVSQRAIASG
jgi:UrcA family protein